MTPIRSRQLGTVALVLAIGWAIVVGYVMHSALPHNTVVLPLEHESQLWVWAPEGWKFFTRDPQEERATFYLRGDDGWRGLQPDSGASWRYAFGLNRRPRVLQMEASLLVDRIPPTAWQQCGAREIDECLAAAPPLAVRNPVRRPRVCGEVGVAFSRPTPWAWRTADGQPVAMPVRVVRLRVAC